MALSIRHSAPIVIVFPVLVVVRDFTLASHTPIELMLRQRQFVNCIINESAAAESKVSSSARAYVCGSLSFHVHGAVKIPLSEDIDAQSWLLHPANDVVDQVILGCGAANVNDLAAWFRKEKECFKAAKLWSTLITVDRNMSKETRAQYTRGSLEALGKIAPGTQPGALQLEVEVRYRAMFYANNTEDKDSGVDWLVALSEDQSRMEHLNSRSRGLVYHLLLIELIITDNQMQTAFMYCFSQVRKRVFVSSILGQ